MPFPGSRECRKELSCHLPTTWRTSKHSSLDTHLFLANRASCAQCNMSTRIYKLQYRAQLLQIAVWWFPFNQQNFALCLVILDLKYFLFFLGKLLCTCQWHLSTTKSLSVSPRSRYTTGFFPRSPTKKEEKCFRKVYEREEYNFHLQIMPKYSF